jgi:hypothetical protein
VGSLRGLRARQMLRLGRWSVWREDRIGLHRCHTDASTIEHAFQPAPTEVLELGLFETRTQRLFSIVSPRVYPILATGEALAPKVTAVATIGCPFAWVVALGAVWASLRAWYRL